MRKIIFLLFCTSLFKIHAQIYLQSPSNGSFIITPKGLQSSDTYDGSVNSNIAIGLSTLSNNTSGSSNIGIGKQTLSNNTTGTSNTGVGSYTLLYNISGFGNTGLGSGALQLNTTGSFNTSVGLYSLGHNVNGDGNVGFGTNSLLYNTVGGNNTSLGANSMYSNTNGVGNTVIGHTSLKFNTTGNSNIAIGIMAGAINTTGNSNIFIGSNSDASVNNLTNAIVIGSNAVVNASNKIRLGNSNITVIEGQVAYSYPSDGRFKNNVVEDVKGLEFITKLRPVSYNFDTEGFEKFTNNGISNNIDYSVSKSIKHNGFIAQEVEKVINEIGYDFDGISVPKDKTQTYSLSYSQFVVPLVKAVQEQQIIIDSLKEDSKKMLELIVELQNEVKKLKNK